MKATYVKRDVCGCGYGVLRDEVPLGKVYELDLSKIHDAMLICGGCGKWTPVKSVWADGGDGVQPGYLPLAIFAMNEAHA